MMVEARAQLNDVAAATGGGMSAASPASPAKISRYERMRVLHPDPVLVQHMAGNGRAASPRRAAIQPAAIWRAITMRWTSLVPS
jgi:hypothetical protein